MAAPMVLNFNIGVLGHVDSGKTSLSKALSTVASTASFDKNPQSKERGITLDLGFSSFTVDLPGHLRIHNRGNGFEGDILHDKLQYTLVDCPGHASLIRTIIGGAQIIDLMMLVVDVTKGMQTQTAECLVIGEILCEKMIVVLNKIDLIPEGKRQAAIHKMTKKMQKTLENTKFVGSPVIPVAAKPGESEASDSMEAVGFEKLIDTVKQFTYRPVRSSGGPFIFAVDHCFSIRGQGTVMTGTILNGKVSVNDNIEIPSLKVIKKVKSLQMFRQPVESAMQGDRVGMCVTQFDPKLLERGIVCTPDKLPTICAAVISVHKIPYFKSSIHTKAKFHITIGHETVMGRVMFFGLLKRAVISGDDGKFDFTMEYKHQEELLGKGIELNEVDCDIDVGRQFALVEFEKPVTCSVNSLVIGSKLDTDIHVNMCRLAFHGNLLVSITDTNYSETVLPSIKIFKNKYREGIVERVVDDYSIIGRALFKKESNIQLFVGLNVTLSTGEDGIIEGGFGQSGKFKVRIPAGLQQTTTQRFANKKKGKTKGGESTNQEQGDNIDQEPVKIILAFKRYAYDPKKQMIQT